MFKNEFFVSDDFKKRVAKMNLIQMENQYQFLYDKYLAMDDAYRMEEAYTTGLSRTELRTQILYLDKVITAMYAGNYRKTEDEIIVLKKEYA